MNVLITGASSGIGFELCKLFISNGDSIIAVARREEKLRKLQKISNGKCKIICLDLSKEENCYELYNKCNGINIDILINNAGFGICNEFCNIDLKKELEMIDLNIKAVHILTKLFLRKMEKNKKGYILNVSSIAGFMPGGPLMASYYATKSYVSSFTLALSRELKEKKSNVKVGILCPGPVNTEFNENANINFSVKADSQEYIAKYAFDRIIKNKMVIIPNFKIKLLKIASKIVPSEVLLKINYKIQKGKICKN